MQIVKYFFEEPAALEPLTPDTDRAARGRPTRSLEALLERPRYARGYLAGTDLAAERVGFTALPQADTVADAVAGAFEPAVWTRLDADGRVTTPGALGARTALLEADATVLLTAADAPLAPEGLAEAAAPDRRHALPALRRLVERSRVVFLPEPAHDGFDWSLFAAAPLREPLREALSSMPRPGALRVFALPYQRARSEQKFYFETWQLGDLPDYVEAW